jgi:hypothetical protein
MLIVHHLGKSQSERIVWLCEELKLPYELKLYARAAAQSGDPCYNVRPRSYPLAAVRRADRGAETSSSGRPSAAKPSRHSVAAATSINAAAAM